MKKIKLKWGNGRVTEEYSTVEDAKTRILAEYPFAKFADEWEHYQGESLLNVEIAGEHDFATLHREAFDA